MEAFDVFHLIGLFGFTLLAAGQLVSRALSYLYDKRWRRSKIKGRAEKIGDLIKGITDSSHAISIFGLLLFAVSWLANNIERGIVALTPSISKLINSPIVIMPCLLLVFVLFWTRGRAPLLYGVFEILVAISMLTIVAYSKSTDLLQRALSLAGAIFVFIRGLDNLEKGLPRWAQKFWSYLFPKFKQAT